MAFVELLRWCVGDVAVDVGFDATAFPGPHEEAFSQRCADTRSPTRQPVNYAILRSMYVRSQHRRTGVGAGLTERFLVWAKESGCVEAHVDGYIANSPAQQFYERHGFVSRSVSRVLAL